MKTFTLLFSILFTLFPQSIQAEGCKQFIDSVYFKRAVENPKTPIYLSGLLVFYEGKYHFAMGGYGTITHESLLREISKPYKIPELDLKYWLWAGEIKIQGNTFISFNDTSGTVHNKTKGKMLPKANKEFKKFLYWVKKQRICFKAGAKNYFPIFDRTLQANPNGVGKHLHHKFEYDPRHKIGNSITTILNFLPLIKKKISSGKEEQIKEISKYKDRLMESFGELQDFYELTKEDKIFEFLDNEIQDDHPDYEHYTIIRNAMNTISCFRKSEDFQVFELATFRDRYDNLKVETIDEILIRAKYLKQLNEGLLTEYPPNYIDTFVVSKK